MPSQTPAYSHLFLRTAGVLLLLAASTAAAASPREEALALVPDDVGFCLIVQNLRDHMDAVASSPFMAQFRSAPLGKTLAASAPARKLAELEEQLKHQLQISWPQLHDDILGDVVVLAFRPSPSGKADEEQDLLVLRARDADLLAGLLSRLNKLQKQSGDLKDLQTRQYRGVEYVYRSERNKEQFYYLHGPLLALSTKEAMLRRVIDRERGGANKEAALSGHLRRLGVQSAPAALWVNPRAFDVQLEAKTTGAPTAEALVFQKVLTYWKALDGMALTVQLRPSSVELGMTFLAKEGDLPPAARKFFAGDSQPSDVWRRLPPNALFAMAGRVDTVALTELVGEFVPDQARRDLRQAANQGAGAVLGLDFAQDVLPNLGPDWGVCISPPTPDDMSLVPPAVVALRVRPGKGEPPIDRLVFNGLNSLAMLVVLGHNRPGGDQLTLRTVYQDKVEVKFLKGDRIFPEGLQPALALKDGYLLLATSPEAIRRFSSQTPAPVADKESPLARLSLAEIRRYVDGHLSPLATQLAAMNRIPAIEARQQLQSLIAFSQLFDRLELTRRADPGRMSLVLRLSTEQPLQRE